MSERCEEECVFVEEQEPSGRLILGPCLKCNTPAMEALEEVRSNLDIVDRTIEAIKLLVERNEWEGIRSMFREPPHLKGVSE